MAKLGNWNPTIVLWAANAIVWPSLALVVTYQFGVFGLGGGLPKVQSLTPNPIRLTMQIADALARNPFDPNGSHWHSAVGAVSASAGELRGVVVMPGVRAAMTGGDVVYVGGQLAGGRVTEIRSNKVIVLRDGETFELEVPSAHRFTLHDLNGTHQSDEPKAKQGIPQ